jgi:hypothetical protein
MTTGGKPMRLAAVAAAALGLALAACSQDDGAGTVDTAENVAIDIDAAETADPATTDLNMGADPNAVDQAINQTDANSGAGDAAADAVDAVENSTR